MAERKAVVLALNNIGRIVRAVVYADSPDGSGRLDLLIPTVDDKTRQVSYFAADKCAHGVEYVHLDEDPSVLGQRERDHFNQGGTTAEVTQDVSTGQETSQAAPEPAAQPQEAWQRLGFASRQAWKEAGKPQG